MSTLRHLLSFDDPPSVMYERMSLCILTYDGECVCLSVCLRACHTDHSCVKMTVDDSWGPWTEH